jgi:hypothetical protein
MKVFIERAETEEIDVKKKYAGNANTHHSPEHLQYQLNQGVHRADQRAPADCQQPHHQHPQEHFQEDLVTHTSTYHSLATHNLDQGKTSELELDMDMVEERMYEEYEDEEYKENNMFNTDRDIVKEHFTYEFEEHEDEEYEDEFHTDKFEEYEKYEEFETGSTRIGTCTRSMRSTRSPSHSHNSGGYMQGATEGWTLDYTDGPLEDDMYNALGIKIGTLSETEMMEELENLAVEEIVAMTSVERPVKQQPAHSGTAHSHTAHRSPAHSSQIKTTTKKMLTFGHCKLQVHKVTGKSDTHISK